MACRKLAGVVVTLLVIASVGSAVAQVNPFRVQQRYKEASQGKSIDDYTKRLNDPDPATRLEAVKNLGESGSNDAIEYLIQATGDPDQGVMIKAIDYLGKLRATAATQILVQKLFMKDVPVPVQQRILVSLGRMGDVRAAAPIGEYLDRDIDPATKGTAIFALGEIGDHASIAKLQSIQTDAANDAHMQRLAGEAVAKINRRMSPSTVAVQVPALEDPDKPSARR
ncbi:MAG: HEAT repeat domain-containing protein [Deltaproteobacteria bacterium]|nr:HEAT repeat domain-containing protein [Deltaproteobacteria bacterium]